MKISKILITLLGLTFFIAFTSCTDDTDEIIEAQQKFENQDLQAAEKTMR